MSSSRPLLRPLSVLVLALVAVMVVAGVSPGASTPLTKKQAKKLFYTKKQAQALFLTGEQATALFGAFCPFGTLSYAGVCIESAARSEQWWGGAGATCGLIGRRLPWALELLGFRDLPGVDLGRVGELTGHLFSSDTSISTLRVPDSGDPIVTSWGFASTFRCVVNK